MTNLDFSHILGQVLNRPVMIRTPAWILKKVLGEMAEETLLVSTRAKPEKLVESGYSFLFPELEPALRFQLGRIRPVQDDLIKENINAESG
jgi:NAD dependent epimerase/dehydratase family enzyme